jgi:hypothetical protein
MKSQKILYSKGKNDECYTPSYAVEPILKHIPKGKIVWCPFDTVESEFFRLIKKQNEVIISHIDTGQDFFKYEPKKWDIIISNPPFTNKRKFFERALDFNKPFALLMSNTWLNDSAPKEIFRKRNKDLQLLMFDKRIEFNDNNKITFSSSYFCYNFLPKQIIMEKIYKNKNLGETPTPCSLNYL